MYETFDQLRELHYSRPNKEECTVRVSEHFLDEWSTISSPVEIAEEFEDSSSVSLIREDVSKGIIEPSETLEADIAVLIGLGKLREVKTERSFRERVELDGEERYSLTWHVVLRRVWNFKQVGSDILEQASVCFIKREREDVQFRAHEDKRVCFLQMQVSYEAQKWKT
ncbi:transposon Ty3-G Gag-Pol polyprotein [Trichonephila clavipes]|nr:transposon Ty3-G Gag-Pol polyprotein [Trichonephila clavipes]